VEKILDSAQPLEEFYLLNRWFKWILILMMFSGFVFQLFLIFLEYQRWSYPTYADGLQCCHRMHYYHYYSTYLQILGFVGSLISFLILNQNKWKRPRCVKKFLILSSPIVLLVLDKAFLEYGLWLWDK